jgi:hypothetical protein
MRARLLLLPILLLFAMESARAADGRFDLVGPKIDVRVTRGNETLPIASVPNLQPGDKLWIHPDLPSSQSVHYLLVCVFLRGTTNPPPPDWFIRIPTWDHKVRDEGAFVTVPPEAQQAVMLLAPETGGDFSTLRSAVDGRPGIFVRASQDLAEAGFEQARIEKYLASIRRVPPSDPADLQKHSDLLARTLALKPNEDCFKRPVDTQFTCLTQTGTQMLLDDGHQSMVAALSNGPSSDFINAASYTGVAGNGLYSAYVGAIVDLVRIMANLHSAQYQYIPAIAFPQGEALNLRLNTPPSFHNPKSVLVIGLPAVQAAVPPPLRPADAANVACLLKPSVVLPIEGAPLVFSTDFAHDVVLHLNTPPGAPAEADIPLRPDAFQGGMILQQRDEHHVPLRDPIPLPNPDKAEADNTPPAPAPEPKEPAAPTQPEPILLTGTIQGRWGFDPFTGPTVSLQQEPGTGWHIVKSPASEPGTADAELIAGHSAELLLASNGSACVHTITFRPEGAADDLEVPFKPSTTPDVANTLALTLPLQHEVTPGDLHLAIQQYGQPKADKLSAHTFAEPAKIVSVEIRAGDRSLVVNGSNLTQVAKLTLGDLAFTPAADDAALSANTLRLALPSDAPAPPTHLDDHLTAHVSLRDGRTLSLPVVVSAARPVITILHKTIEVPPNAAISLPDANDLPLSERLDFTLKTPLPFPRNGQIEIATLDGTLRAVLTLAPSGGLLLQDPHTIVATLDPLRSFGPSAFGPLHVRAVYPAQNAADANQSATGPESPASDWLPLATLVRLPTLTQLQCPADVAQPCTLSGSNLFLIDAISASPSFDDPINVPDGYTGATLTVPHAAAATLFLHLRDDPASVDPATIPLPAAPPAPEHHAQVAGRNRSQTAKPGVAPGSAATPQ